MPAEISPGDLAALALRALEDIAPTGHSVRKYSTAQRVLDAIAEIDGRPFDAVTGQFLEGGVVGVGRLQTLDAIEETILVDGQLLNEFAYYYEV